MAASPGGHIAEALAWKLEEGVASNTHPCACWAVLKHQATLWLLGHASWALAGLQQVEGS